ncbi:DUF803 domain membrane protein [Aspergillus rambellii]|uniref:DUF803 domain membrane protein n=2 Tax=Aspergillus subgen. Nidulantes TaxID=2720870 RepID=A0A0F8X211_9EURO|nr:DUF803 domain membrane protein [Aspergillus ochraceoroseus]KKK23710.1 DUF803 domain membrane protein [Aspergillus rambellii]
MLSDKYIGLLLAILSTMAIGTSFVITKMVRFPSPALAFLLPPTVEIPLPEAWVRRRRLLVPEESNLVGRRNYMYGDTSLHSWVEEALTGFTVAVGEVANFAAYAFAPAILVTPLGALSVLIGAVLGSYFLKERLGALGKLGCAMCLLGSVVIVLHAPPDKPVERIDEILHYALQPGFLVYCLAVAIFSTVMIYRVAPVYGKKNPLIFISICSTVGSVSVMSIKAFGIAVKLTIGGNNQFTHASTYVFMIVTGFCILTQMNYINKALNEFSTSIVNPLYYVTFTTATLCASFILFKGFNTTDPVNTISLLCGFLIIFSGVYLLNLSRHDPDGRQMLNTKFDDEGIPTDGITSYQTRRSIQARRSGEPHRRSSSSIAYVNGHGDREGLIRSYDIENQAFGLSELTEESDGEPGPTYKRSNTSEHPKKHDNQ